MTYKYNIQMINVMNTKKNVQCNKYYDRYILEKKVVFAVGAEPRCALYIVLGIFN